MTDQTAKPLDKMPTQTYKHTRDIPLPIIADVYKVSKTQSQASKALSASLGFSDRAWRYALTKMEIQGFLEPTILGNAFTKRGMAHIESINAKRKEHGVAPAEMPKFPIAKEPPKEDNVMATVHLRVEYNGLSARGFHPIYFEASYSRIINRDAPREVLTEMKNMLYERILNTPNYDRLANTSKNPSMISEDGEYNDLLVGVEVEEIGSTHHYDGEVSIPQRPRRSR